jgi:RNA polymerase sigma-70 factor, ECF subfamily
MVYSELIDLIQKKDTSARKHWFDTFYGALSAIALRYSKNAEQAESLLIPAMHDCFEKLESGHAASQLNSEAAVVRQFIRECVTFIRNIRSEYYVSSTVYASVQEPVRSYNLFEDPERPDFSAVSADVLVPAMQQLVPAQRLIFNLHVIDGFSLAEAAELLEASEPTVKSNLEKARFNLQKNIEKTFKKEKS